MGRSGSIVGLLVRDSQTSESLYCVLEQDTETGIKQKDKKSSRSNRDDLASLPKQLDPRGPTSSRACQKQYF